MARRTERRVRFLTPAGNPSDPQGLFAYLQRYIEHLGVKGYTEMGIHNAERYVRAFIRWCEPRALTQPTEITKPIIERYQRHLFYHRKDNGEPLSVFSQRSALVPLRGYFRWLTKQNYLLYNPASDLELPRMKRVLPKHVLTESEAERVLAGADVREPMGIRDRAMMEVLYSTGLRRMELANLRVYEIDRERGLVFVNQGKWQKDRWVPIGERALAWVQKYVDEVRPTIVMPPDDGTLFLTRTGVPFNEAWLSTTVSQYVQRANLGKHGGCHLFRHTMATLMLENGADIRFIQAMLGHADLKSTQIYTHVAVKQLKAIHTATHPAKTRKAKRATGSAEHPTADDVLDALDAESVAEDAWAEDRVP
jgi:integrase/recombinase XerD